MDNPLNFKCRMIIDPFTYNPSLRFNFTVPVDLLTNDFKEMTKEELIEKWSIVVQTEFAECLNNHIAVPM